MFELNLKFETRDLEHDEKLSRPYMDIYKLKRCSVSFTHLLVEWHDGPEYTTYDIGTVKDNKFVTLLSGEGAEFPDINPNMGGVFIEVHLHEPQSIVLNKE